jgi:hypothetical protein
MNVLFHVTTAVGVAVVLTDTTKIKSVKESIKPAFFAFVCGIMIHGVLDYMPHTYPLSAKMDAILGFLIICVATFISNRKYTFVVVFAFLGSIFPDLIDLLPSILNKYSGMDISFYQGKLFPWHWSEYSGSIFTGKDIVSDMNHILVVLLTFIICWFRRTDFKKIFLDRI